MEVALGDKQCREQISTYNIIVGEQKFIDPRPLRISHNKTEKNDDVLSLYM